MASERPKRHRVLCATTATFALKRSLSQRRNDAVLLADPKLDRDAQMVWGYASTEAEDEQGEIVTRDALAAALADYMRFANIREMHQPSAVGVAEEAAVD